MTQRILNMTVSIYDPEIDPNDISSDESIDEENDIFQIVKNVPHREMKFSKMVGNPNYKEDNIIFYLQNNNKNKKKTVYFSR